jgi:hypothetical protein
MVAFFFLYIPWFQTVIGTTTVPFEYYLFPIAFGIALLMLEESVWSILMELILEEVPGSSLSSWNVGEDCLVIVNLNSTR